MSPAEAITIVFNRSNLTLPTAEKSVLEFFRLEDRRRLGGRYYAKPERQRSMVLLSPEKFREGHPHYHGLIRLPEEYRYAGGAADYEAQLDRTFSKVFPGGSIRLSNLDDPEGWVAYASKENDLIGGTSSLFSHMHISAKAFA